MTISLGQPQFLEHRSKYCYRFPIGMVFSLLIFLHISCDGGGVSVSYNNFGEKYIEATCMKLLECCDAVSLDYFSDLESCIESYTYILYREFYSETVITAASKGDMFWDEGTATKCLQEISEFPCVGTAQNAPNCVVLFSPTLVNGSSCLLDDSCRSFRCVNSVCQSPGVAGVTCLFDYHCQATHYCPTYSGQLYGVCTLRKSQGERCKWSSDCAEGYVCDADILSSYGVCKLEKSKSYGMDCTHGLECLDGLFCDEGVCLSRRSLGESCGDWGWCEESLYCDMASSTCLPRGGVGDHCSRYGYFECENGLSCLSQNTCEYRCSLDFMKLFPYPMGDDAFIKLFR